MHDHTVKELIVEEGLKRMERKIDAIERRNPLSDKDRVELGKTIQFISSVRDLKVAYKKALDIGLGKEKPSDVDLEQVVLGALILEGESIKRVARYLMPHHFYLDAHKRIYESILNLHTQNLIIDLRTVYADIKKRGFVDSIGGNHYIPTLTSLVNSSVNIEYQSRILIEHAIKRELISLAGELLHDAYKDSSDCFDLIQRTKDKLAEIEHINVRK